MPKQARTFLLIDRRSVPLLLVAGAAFCGVAPAVIAQDYVIRDAQGRRTGTVDRLGSDRYVLRDAAGRRTGMVGQEDGGRLVIRDPHQRRIGTIEQDLSKGLVVRDLAGRRVDTLTPQADGSFAIRAPSGRHTGTVSRRYGLVTGRAGPRSDLRAGSRSAGATGVASNAK